MLMCNILYMNYYLTVIYILNFTSHSCVDLSFCCIIFLRTLDFSLSQNTIVVIDKLSCSTEHFIRSENNQTALIYVAKLT